MHLELKDIHQSCDDIHPSRRDVRGGDTTTLFRDVNIFLIETVPIFPTL